VREDDTPEVVEKRLQVYNAAAAPVEDYFREAGVLLDFEITGGIPETTPRLMAALEPYIRQAQAAGEEGQQAAEAAA
jgi:adenylate kinase